jgi:Na+/melibiose symporter-like transporter
MAVRIVGLIACSLALLYSLVSLGYLAWISATLTPPQRETAKLYGAVWFGIGAACAAVAVWLLVSMIRTRASARQRRGFEVGPDNGHF